MGSRGERGEGEVVEANWPVADMFPVKVKDYFIIFPLAFTRRKIRKLYLLVSLPDRSASNKSQPVSVYYA